MSESLGRYCLYYDGGEFDQLRRIFHPEAVIDFGDRFCGNRDEFVSWARSQREGGNRYSHQVSNIVIDSTGTPIGKASICSVSALVEASQPNNTVRLVRGYYRDKWLRSEGRWVIKARNFAINITAEF
ncbi:MAG: nuclear transport factor 2 family protein [Parasphingorhabdus sp.]